MPERRVISISKLHERQSCWMYEILLGWHGGVKDVAWGNHMLAETVAEMKSFVLLPEKEVRTVVFIFT